MKSVNKHGYNVLKIVMFKDYQKCIHYGSHFYIGRSGFWPTGDVAAIVTDTL